MIAKIIVYILLVTVLPFVYIDQRYLRRMKMAWWKRALWLTPCMVMSGYGLYMFVQPHFAPSSIYVLNIYLFLLGLIVIPPMLFSVFSLLGLALRRIIPQASKVCNVAGTAAGFFAAVAVVYGSTVGFNKIEVKRVSYTSPFVPKAFDGYTICHFSDAHVGTYVGRYVGLLQNAIDTINALRPDAVMFTGDLQNMQPSELSPLVHVLGSIKARDGVYSVLGNHDYPEYIKATDAVKRANLRETVSRERQMGWRLLLNENIKIRRGTDSLVVAGMENDGRPPFPQHGDIRRTLQGVGDDAFVVMMQHDPTSWQRTILSKSKVQLTLSGHTHAMQFEMLGWSPASLIYDEWGGMYQRDGRAMYVSVGMGGLIPFRLGASREVVLITLHHG